MTKLLKSVLEKISENNNEYRNNLRGLNSDIDSKTSSLVGELVTSSNYTLDFSKALEEAKDELVTPISRVIESYVIRDLRSVESVNEQFVEKINYKLETANIQTEEDRTTFSNSLNNLLNNKYLEIVKIKRTPFLNEENKNDDIEDIISNYVLSLKQKAAFNENLDSLIDTYKNDVYNSISSVLIDISNLYQNNFINEISSNLGSSIEVKEVVEPVSAPEVEEKTDEEFKPYIPDSVNMPEIPSFELPETYDNELPSITNPVDLEKTVKLDPVEEIHEVKVEDNNEELSKPDEEVNEIEFPKVEPIEVDEENVETKEIKEEPKHSYNIDEILKIAKSPILEMPEVVPVKEVKEDSFVSVNPISITEEIKEASEFDCEEIVKEMINRLSNRLNEIRTRKQAYDENKQKLTEDETFVNDLIESSIKKKEYLDKFEKELDEKEKELDEKKRNLDKKISDIMPFANAVLKVDEK